MDSRLDRVSLCPHGCNATPAQGSTPAQTPYRVLRLRRQQCSSVLGPDPAPPHTCTSGADGWPCRHSPGLRTAAGGSKPHRGDLRAWRVRGLLGTALLLGSRCCGVIAYMKAGEAPLLFLISSFFFFLLFFCLFFFFLPPTPRFPGFVQKHKRVIHHFSSSTRRALTSPSPRNLCPPEQAKKARSGEGRAPQLLQAAWAQRATFSAGISGCQPRKGEGQNSMLGQKTDIGGREKQFAPV